MSVKVFNGHEDYVTTRFTSPKTIPHVPGRRQEYAKYFHINICDVYMNKDMMFLRPSMHFGA